MAPLPLGTTDVPEMLELTAASEPGPFLPQTIQMGSYFGIRAGDGRLVAIAGERLRSTAFAEISAVCTHPEFRGHGYARDLTTFLAAQIRAAGLLIDDFCAILWLELKKRSRLVDLVKLARIAFSPSSEKA
jgi:ribosomal protein S18 acetylase RimI-like enzyme